MTLALLTAAFLPFVIGYLCGSIPFGLLIARMGGAGDVRSIGSGNIGATNVLRTGKKGLAAATLLCDALKGTLPALFFMPDIQSALVAGIGAFIGHLYPVWLKFKGGKGIATYVGVALAFWWQGLLAFAVVWLAVAAITRYSSLAALCATIATPLAFWLSDSTSVAIGFAIMSVIAWWKHRENISRLLSGTETKIGSKG